MTDVESGADGHYASSREAAEDAVITDAHGKTWRVFDYEFFEGRARPVAFGHGRYRGFEPTGGGPLRTFSLLHGESRRERSPVVLLAQLALSKAYMHRVEGRSPRRTE